MTKKFEDNLKILGYTDFSKLEKLMCRRFPLQLESISDEVTNVPKNINDLNDYVERNDFTHVFILDEHFHPLDDKFNLNKCKVPLVGLMGDHWVPWAINRKENYISNNNISDVFVFTDRFLESYKCTSNFHAVLTGYDTKTFFDQEKERDVDLLFSGAMKSQEPWVYPVRNWLAEILPRIGEKEGLKLKILEHPKHYTEEKVDHQKIYADILNRAKIATGGSSYWKLPLQKLYEIPACGTILLSDAPDDDIDFFNGNILEINSHKINSLGYEDVVRRKIMDTLENYDSFKTNFQPFKSEEDRFKRSYEGKALEMRKILSQTQK